MIRAYVHDNYLSAGFSVTFSIVDHPPEGSMDVRPRILHLNGPAASFAVSWDELDPDGTAEPTLRLDDYSARALLDALTRHYQGAEDTRALRRDYDAERKRVDTLAAALSALALKLADPA